MRRRREEEMPSPSPSQALNFVYWERARHLGAMEIVVPSLRGW